MAELRSGVAWDALKVPDEEYLNLAVTNLLPRYYANGGADETGSILHRMAGEFTKRHGDSWLSDVLQTPHSPQAAEAFAAMAQAAQAETQHQAVLDTAGAEAALRLFRAAGSQAGALRAEFEIVQASRETQEYKRCATGAEALGLALRPYSYSWLRTQTMLETVVCEGQGIDFERDWARRRAALKMAADSRYSVLKLRALGLSAMWQSDTGNAAEALRQYMQGLDLYWTAKYPLIRGQFLYSELSWLPRTEAPNAAVAWAKENLAIVRTLKLQDYYAGALHQLALDEMAAGMPTEAQTNIKEAVRVIETLPSDEQRRNTTMYTTISLAETEADLGRVDAPLARLAKLRPQLADADPLLRLRFDATMGRLYLRHGDYKEAELLLQGALALGNDARAKLSDNSRLPWARSMGDVYRALVDCQIQRNAGARESWQLWSGYRAALFDRDEALKAGPMTVAPGEVLLSFAELPSGMVAWLVTPREFLFRRLDTPAKTLQETGARLLRGCTASLTPQPVLRADARQLSQWLLGPWENQLDGVRAVVIEADGPASSLPWPVLVRSNQRYWSQDFAIRIHSGIGSRAANGPPLQTAERTLAVGNPALTGSDLPPLPGARVEAEQVSSLFPRSISLVGKQATLTEVRRRLEQAELFHFAGHGYGGDGGGLILRGKRADPLCCAQRTFKISIFRAAGWRCSQAARPAPARCMAPAIRRASCAHSCVPAHGRSSPASGISTPRALKF